VGCDRGAWAAPSGTVAQVAAHLGISRPAVRYLLTEHPPRAKNAPTAKAKARRPYSWDELSVRLTQDELRKLYVEQGWTLSDVARQFDTTVEGSSVQPSATAFRCGTVLARADPIPSGFTNNASCIAGQ
jgi:hypothetical protein